MMPTLAMAMAEGRVTMKGSRQGDDDDAGGDDSSCQLDQSGCDRPRDTTERLTQQSYSWSRFAVEERGASHTKKGAGGMRRFTDGKVERHAPSYCTVSFFALAGLSWSVQ